MRANKASLISSITPELKKEEVQLHEGKKSDPLFMLKQGVWLYFLLLIFEGALRKWVLPSLSTPLLIIRDPLVAWLLVKAYQKGIFKVNGYIVLAWTIVTLSLYTTLFWGHGNAIVALYGFRIFFLQFPVIFLVAQIFDKSDVVKMGKVLLWIHIGMTLLVAVQFFSPQTAWVNRGIGGEMEGSGFTGGGGYFRVPGTFSFTNGLSSFFGFVNVFVFYFWLDDEGKIPKWLLLLASFCLLAAIPLSISRGVFFQVIVTAIFSIFATAKRPKTLFKILGAFLSGAILFYLLTMFSFFQTAMMAFTDRYTKASEVEGGLEGTLIDRYLGGSLSALTNDIDIGFWGAGLGMGTNAGANLLTGKSVFLISEGELGRLIGEMGILLGFIAIAMRFALASSMFVNAWKMINHGNYLPWLLFSFCGTLVLMGTWAQPTALGFAVFPAGLLLSSLKTEAH
ncbi:MAG: hypothetical protein J7604_05695 [Sporocytophaga sp.]|uniref:hypothetical protein n=1 Tax=Sporocytophaga sp. TaxID=2231183 RepID=UPI001B049257|nr:hypothetical protein [Sporocytophaga sp.]MBO9699684.1 hypothetical protein [Sporocytophaga sp.]